MSSVSEIFDRWQIQKSEYAVYAGFNESLFLLGLQSTADLISDKHRLGNDLAGQYKRGIGMAIHIGVRNFSGAIAANIYRSKDSPHFRVGRTLFITH